MPEAEPRAEDTDAAPGTDQATPDSEQPTLFPEADAPPEGGLDRDQATASPEDEWDSTESAPAADPFATGVLEIVTSLDTGEAVGATTTEPTSDAVTDTPTTDTISEVTTEEVPSSESSVAEAEEPASEATPEMTRRRPHSSLQSQRPSRSRSPLPRRRLRARPRCRGGRSRSTSRCGSSGSASPRI